MKNQLLIKKSFNGRVCGGLGLAAVLLSAGAAPGPAQTGPAAREVVALAKSCLNLRRGPALTEPPLQCLPPGRRMVLLESRDGWGRVRLPDNQEGWVALRLVGPAKVAPASATSSASELERAQQRIKQLEAELSRQAEKNRSALESGSNEVRAGAPPERETLERESIALRKEIAAVRSANALLATSAAKRAAAESEARSRLGGLEEALTEAQAEGKRLENESMALRREIAELLDTNERLRAAEADRAASKSEAESRHGALEQELATARAQAEERAKETTALSSEIAELRDANERLTAAEAERAASKSEAESRLGVLEQELATARTQAEERASETTALSSEIAELRDANERLTAAEAERAASKSEAESRLGALEQELATARAQAEERASETTALSSEIAELRDANERLTAAEAERSVVESEAQDRLEQLEEGAAAAEALGIEKKALEAQIDALRSEALAERQRLVDDHAAGLRAAEIFLAESEAQRLETVEQLEALRRENEMLRDRAETEQLAEAAPAEPEVAEEEIAAVPLPAEQPPEIAPAEASTNDPDLMGVVEAWARAWSQQRVEDYLFFYSKTFQPPGEISREAWEGQRRARISGPRRIEVGVALVDLRRDGPNRAEVEFLQSYDSEQLSDVVAKTLELVREDGTWKIAAERVD